MGAIVSGLLKAGCHRRGDTLREEIIISMVVLSSVVYRFHARHWNFEEKKQFFRIISLH